jgi:pimeloyl-ACP methyl ester carboxylesterase
MTAWQPGDIIVGGLRLHYTRTGGDGPPLVLAHGVGDDGLCWTTVAEALAPEYDVIMVDARGHGRSEAPEHGYRPNVQAEDLAGLIAALGLRRPIVLGHSMGAATALMLASAHPNLPAAILLEDPPPWWMTQPQDTAAEVERRAQRRAGMLELKRMTRQELIAGQRAVAPTWPDAEIERWADSKQRFSPNVVEVFDTNNAEYIDWTAALRRITCPALLIGGDPALGGLVTEENAAALRSLIPQLQVVHIPAAGHSIRHDQFARYMDAVRAFLAEIAVH